MAWYFGPRDSAKSGLKRVKLAYKMPMNSTGKEKFTVYVYFKTDKWDAKDPWSDCESEADDDSSCSDNEESNISSSILGNEETCLNRSASVNSAPLAAKDISGQINNSRKSTINPNVKNTFNKKREIKIEINKS